METCLIVCRAPSGLPALRRMKSDRPVVVASDDPRVQESARTMPGVAHVAYIERGESFWTVASDVKAVIRQVDDWLWSLDPSLPRDVLGWSGHVEGGLTGQRVQDGLLLIRSYQHLFRAFDVRDVRAIVGPEWAWEAEVLMACARAEGIPAAWRRTGLLKTWAHRIDRTLRPVAKAVHYLMREVMLGGGRPWSPRRAVELDGAIAFQVCSSREKHVDNVRHLMDALARRGEHPVGLCWDAGDRFGRESAVDQLQAAGVPAVALERFVSLRDMLWSIWTAVKTFLASRRRRGGLDALVYQGVPLAPLLGESIWDFMAAVLPASLRYARALEACLGTARPIAIKPWGGGDFVEGKVALRLVHRGGGSMYFHYWLGGGIPGWPYTDLTYRPDLFLAKSPSEAALVKDEYRLDDAQISIVGQARWAHLHPFPGLHTVAESRRHLNLPIGGDFVIGLDPGAALSGYQSFREQMDLLVAVLNVARECPGVVIAVKPHPSYHIEHLIPFMRSYRNPNILMLPKTAPVDHFLNAIDVVVTKYSTLILEAAVLGRCAISAILDGEDRFKAFGDLPAVVTTAGELHGLLSRLARDRDARQSWMSEQRARQEERLPYFYYQAPTSAPDLAADAIMRHLDLRRRA